MPYFQSFAELVQVSYYSQQRFPTRSCKGFRLLIFCGSDGEKKISARQSYGHRREDHRGSTSNFAA
jgi:hypothetical protein